MAARETVRRDRILTWRTSPVTSVRSPGSGRQRFHGHLLETEIEQGTHCQPTKAFLILNKNNSNLGTTSLREWLILDEGFGGLVGVAHEHDHRTSVRRLDFETLAGEMILLHHWTPLWPNCNQRRKTHS